MTNIKLTQDILTKVNEELNQKIVNNHITRLSVINSTDVVMHFSYHSKERLFVSLNHQSPFISMIGRDFVLPTTMGNFNENLRRYIKDTYILKIEIINNDRIIKFTLGRTNDFFERETYYLILELIPTKTNLIILDANEVILFAYHYFDITHTRPILKGMKYIQLEKNENYQNVESDYELYQKEVTSYLLSAEKKRKIEDQKPLYNHLVSKRKSLKKKIGVLNHEKEKATEGLIYKEYGDMIYALMYDEAELADYIKDTLGDKYDDRLSPTDNANLMYKKYKKNRRTIEYDDIEIAKANKEHEEIDYIISIFDYLDEDEINDLYIKYMPYKNVKGRKKKSDPRMPFYIKYEGTTIGFGKSSEQNMYLTFKKANKSDIYLHISEYRGAHVIIFKDNPNNDELLVASEICLILSNKTAGDIRYAKVSELKKGNEPGEALMKSYKLITLKNIRETTYELLTTQKRFQD